MAPNIKGKALITGASSGIGASFADVLAEAGADLIVVARRRDRLQEKAAQLEKAHGVSVEVLAADLSNSADLEKVEQRLEKGDVGLLVNNAGLGDLGAFVELDRAIHERMLAVNVLALTRLAHAAAQAMVKAGTGTIINVASGMAFQLLPGAAVYSGTKAFVVQFTQALDLELKDKGLTFQALVPGLTRTELGGAHESGFFDNFPAELVMGPEAVARASLKGLELGELVCFPRLEDLAKWDTASEAIKAIGRDPQHNRVASRYGVKS